MKEILTQLLFAALTICSPLVTAYIHKAAAAIDASTAEKVKNAWLGFGKRYRTLLSTFRSFTDDLHGRIGVDRSKNTWYRYLATMKHLQAFLTAKYRVSDIALAELEQSFIEQFHVYLKTERALKLTSICRYLDCLINVVKVSFNDGITVSYTHLRAHET